MAIAETDMLNYFCRFTDEPQLQKYLAELVLAAGISNPSDLGFLCSGSSGIPKSVQLALDPDMQAQALQVLDLACRTQIGLKQGVLDLASFQLARYQRTGRLCAGYIPPDPAHPSSTGGAEDPRRGMRTTTARSASSTPTAPTARSSTTCVWPSSPIDPGADTVSLHAEVPASSAGEDSSVGRGRSVAMGYAPSSTDLPAVAPPGRALPAAASEASSKRRLRSCSLVVSSMPLAAQDRQRMDAAVDKAYACFRENGQETSRYREVFVGGKFVVKSLRRFP